MEERTKELWFSVNKQLDPEISDDILEQEWQEIQRRRAARAVNSAETHNEKDQ